MKTVKYKCDNSECRNEVIYLKTNNWIEIGSDNDTLFINNHFYNRNLISLQNYKSIHFCGPGCLTDYFFDKTKKNEP